VASALVFYISGHGFGHASRSIELIRALRRRVPDLRVIVRTSAPPWFLHAVAHQPIEVVSVDVDTGLAQIDSLNIDESETARRAARFYENFGERVAAEASWLRGGWRSTDRL